MIEKTKIQAIIIISKFYTAEEVLFLEDLSSKEEYQDYKLNKAIKIALSKLKSTCNNN